MNESPQSPRVLGNRYEVGDLLGRGGMAEVHLGRDTRLGRVVAIKLLRTDLARDPVFQARFRREAQSAAGLNHPAIVAVYDTGEEIIAESGGSGVALPYIVMEYVEGRTLRDILREGKPLDVQQALQVTAGVLSALDYSHRMGIVHRDIKPANVMLTAGGDVKVMDFGIARALADVSATMTQTQAVIGTAQYLSPEQARGETVDARSDLYSAGCLLYELATGRPPFVADSPVAVAYQHVREVPQPPSAYNPLITDVVDRISLHALAKDREARYQTATEFRSDVEAAVAGRSAAATVPLTAPRQAGSTPGDLNQAATEYIEQAGSTRAYSPAQTMPQPAVGVGAPAGGGTEIYARRGDRRGQGGGRSAGFIALAVAVVLLFAGAAYGVSYFVGQNSAANASVPVPRVIGLSQEQAVNQLRAAGLSARIVSEPSNTVEAGRVIRTEPEAGASAKRGSEIQVHVSTGAQTVRVPDVRGRSVAEATSTLRAAGLTVASVTEAVPGRGVEQGLVVSTKPTAGREVNRDSEVILQVSNGRIVIPDVVGRTQEEAVRALDAAGVDSIIVKQVPSDQPENRVIKQEPGPGERDSVDQVTISVTVPEPEPTEDEQPSESPSVQDGDQNGGDGDGPGNDQADNTNGQGQGDASPNP